VIDVYGNTSRLSFEVQSDVNADSGKINQPHVNNGIFFDYKLQNSISEEHISISFPPNSFYQSFYFLFDSAPGDSTTFSQVFKIHNKFTPVHKSFTLKIALEMVPSHLKDKMYIALINENGGWYIGSKWENGWLTTKSRLLGTYTIKADTISPVITPLNISEGKTITSQNTINIKIKDKETGIKKYTPTMNGEWILMEYDPKKNLLVYEIGEHISKGDNDFKLVVTDLLNNETTYEVSLRY
jgi:hypothetical protein